MSKLLIKNKFATTPNELLNNRNISLKAKGIYGYLQSKPDGWTFSVKGMMSQLQEGKLSISSALKELENHQYLLRNNYQDKKSGKWKTDYILYSEPYTGYPYTDEPSTDDTESVKPIHLVRKNKVKKNSKKEQDKEGVSFEDFWKVYPNKKSKHVACKSWSKVNKQEQVKIIEHVIERKEKDEQWVKDEGRFIPHPSTFLNQKRWYDEYEEVDEGGGVLIVN